MEYKSVHTTGPTYRTPRVGPELELLHNYVNSYVPEPPRGQAISLFLEPRLESGFPDAVIVYWHIGTTENWSHQRTLLTKYDIRVMHYLVMHPAAKTEDLKKIFNNQTELSLSRLFDADMIQNKRGSWKIKPLSKVFAVKKIIAIEAKISAWKKGLEQAIQNTWFASESYLLIKNKPCKVEHMNSASSSGVGLLTPTSPLNKSIIKPKKEKIPVSYASWLFNEWSWQFPENILS